MKNILLIILTFFTFSFIISSSNYSFATGGTWVDPPAGLPDCSEQDPPGNTGCTATPICNLNGYCGTTSSSYGSNYWSQLNNAFCGSIENNAFLTFTADESSITFDVYVYNCEDNKAIQIMIFKANNCGSGAVQNLICVDEMYAQNNAYVVTANGLTPGEEYYIMIDGFGGDVCDYTFVATDGVATPINITTDAIDNTICAGEIIVIEADGGLGTYTWTGTGLSSTTGSVVTITPPAVPGVYNYHIESTGTIGMCPGMTDYDFIVTVDDCGCVTPPLHLNNLTICQDESVDLQDAVASTSSPLAIPIFYNSQPNAHDDINALTNTVVNTAGTYWVRVIDPDEPTCFSVYPLEVEVVPVDFTYEVEPESCGNGNGTITITPTGGTAPYSYNINNTYSTINTGEFTDLNEGTYNIIVSDDNGCQATQAVIVSSIGTPVVTAPNDLQICLGESVTLTASNPENASISWSHGVSDGVSFTPSAAGTFTYTVTGSLGGCSASDEVIVTVNVLPTVDAGSDQTICEGTSIALSGTGASNYSWDNNVTNGVSFNPPVGTTVYSVVGTDNNGCQNTDQVSITVTEPIEPSFMGDELSGCKPHEVNFTNTSAINGTNCVWNFGDGTTVEGCGNVSHTYTNSGFYTVSLTITDNVGCVSTFTAPNYIDIVQTTIADFTADPMTVSNLTPTVNFFNNSSHATDYTWNFGDETASSNEFSPSHDYPTENGGEYTVTLITSNGSEKCNDTTKMTIVVVEETIFYVPNTFTPDNDNYNEVFKPIFSSGFDPYSYSLEIYNRWGEIIFESHDWNYGWNGSYGTKSGVIVKEGTYIWKIKVKEKDKDKHNEYVGHLLLLK